METNKDQEKMLSVIKDVKKEIQEDVKKALIPIIADILAIKPECDAITDLDHENAAELLKKVSKYRTKAEASRKALKDESLKTGRAIDDCAKIVQSIITPIETRLQKIADTPKREEEQRKALLLNQRQMILAPFKPDLIGINLAEMDEERFCRFVEQSKKLHEIRLQEEKLLEEAKSKIASETVVKMIIDNKNNNNTDNQTEARKLTTEKVIEFKISMTWSDYQSVNWEKPVFVVYEDNYGFEQQTEIKKLF
jgi:hypothetical protein